ncbi:MAG: oxidoreductase [Candidatus Nanopelagicales bacterium]
MPWTLADVPDVPGRVAVVTGASSGIGWEAAAALAARGADVTLAVRDGSRGQAALRRVQERHPTAHARVRLLDLADLASVRSFAARWQADHPGGLDLLVNNAGVMAIPRRVTPDGFETQFATNHLGHFALTGLLLTGLAARRGSRVVTVSSMAHRSGRIDFDDLMGARRYRAWSAYAQSKLANLLFAAELQRRLDAAGLPVVSVSAHPGHAATNLQVAGPRMRTRPWQERLMTVGNRVLGQPAAIGALPVLFAATAPGLAGDSYVGPDGVMEMRGHPRLVGRSGAARSTLDARRLWQASEDLTGVRFPLGDG